MSGETVVFRAGTPLTLEASGGSISNNSVVQADDANLDMSSYANYPDCEFYLTCAFGTAPTEGTTVMLMARPLDIDGTNDSLVPELARPTQLIGVFEVDNTTSTQYLALRGIYAEDVPKFAAYYLGNNGTGQTLSSGWKLVAVPRTVGPA